MFFGATLLHAAVFMGLYVLLDLRPFRVAVRGRGRRRRSATRSSAWWRSSWSSCCPGRSNGGGPQKAGSAGKMVKQMAFRTEDRADASAIRLSVLQYRRSRCVFSVLAVSFWVLQVVAAREVRGDGREQPSADAGAARAARRAVRPQRQGAGREPPFLQHLDRPRAHQGSRTAPSGCSPSVLGFEEREVREIVDRHRREPTYRPIMIVQDATLRRSPR